MMAAPPAETCRSFITCYELYFIKCCVGGYTDLSKSMVRQA